MNTQKVKVLYIAGAGRSGSTILHNILGQLEGYAAVGELRYLWERGLRRNKLCGCGTPFHDCEFWQAVLQTAYGGREKLDANQMAEATEEFRIHHLLYNLIPGLNAQRLTQRNWFLTNVAKLYQAIQSVTNCRVIVDSSKNPGYGYILRMLPQVDLYVIHFIRDPHAVAHSWTTKKAFQPDTQDPDYMPQRPAIRSALQWNARNLSAEFVLPRSAARRLVLRYEDFLQSPQLAIEQVVSLLNEPVRTLPFNGANSVELTKPNHSVFGNLVRFQTGTVKLQNDIRWYKQMSSRNKRLVTALTWPLMLKYGYFSLAAATTAPQPQEMAP